MEIIFWVCTIIIVCFATGVMFYKPYLGIAFVIIFIPFEGNININCVSKYPLEVILTILVCICVYKLLVNRENHFRNNKLIIFYLPFMLCVLISLLESMEMSLAIKELVRWFELIVIYFLTINLIDDQKKLKVIIYTVVLTMVVVSVFGIVFYFTGILTIDRVGATSFFGHPNSFAGYINLILPVLFCLLLTRTLLWERILLGIFTIITVLAWFLTFSKSGWLSLLITIIIVFFLAKLRKRAIALLAMLLVVFAINFMSSNIKNDFNKVFYSAGYCNLRARVVHYPIGFSMVKNDLITGIGIGNYPLLINKYSQRNDFQNNNLHNVYLQIFVEIGLMGLCSFILWLTGTMKYLVISLKSLKKSRNYDLYVGLMGGAIAFLFGNFANVLTVHGIHLQWGIILGLAVQLIQLEESKTCQKVV